MLKEIENVVRSSFDSSFIYSVKTPDNSGDFMLHPLEARCCEQKAGKSKKQFFLGRAAARAALANLNMGIHPVLVGEHNEPLWPPGVVGSITHTEDIAVAVAAYEEKTAGIGIDLERVTSKINLRISEKICTESEKAWISNYKNNRHLRLVMMFSAKESVYKAFFSTFMPDINFLDIELKWNETKGIFCGYLKKGVSHLFPAGFAFEVGCRSIRSYVFTYLTLPPVLLKKRKFLKC